MKRWFGYAMAGLIVLGAALALRWSMYLEEQEPARPAVNVAVVVYSGENADRWRSFEQGMRQACSELGIEAPVLGQTAYDRPDKQAQLIQREIENGAKGLVIVAADAQVMAETLDMLPAGVPVVLAESGAGDGLEAVSADDYAMGRAIADTVNTERGTIAVLYQSTGRDSVALRYEGFSQRMEELGRDVVVLECGEGDELKAFLASSLAVYSPQLNNLVLLDNESLETAIDALPAAMVDAQLFGIGSSGKVVHALDQGVVEAIVFQNEYAIGYISTMELAEKMGLGKAVEWEAITYRVVTRDIMYEPDAEKLLFPIIQ